MELASDGSAPVRMGRVKNPPAESACFAASGLVVWSDRSGRAAVVRKTGAAVSGAATFGDDLALYVRAQEIAAGRGFDYAARRFEFDNYGAGGDGEISIIQVLGSVYSQAGGEPIAQYRYAITLGKRQGQMKVVAIHMEI